MNEALWLFAAQATLGGFDTLYFHEWRARLPAWGAQARPELDLHALRDLIYGVLFGTLPWLAWQGAFAYLLLALIAAEVVITLADFVVEDRVRRPQGGVFPGERVTHALMGIVYGGALVKLLPVVWRWSSLPAGLVASDPGVPAVLRAVLGLMAAGVLVSGLRDFCASRGVGLGRWPWPAEPRA
jgi:hypothetical protein